MPINSQDSVARNSDLNQKGQVSFGSAWYYGLLILLFACKRRLKIAAGGGPKVRHLG
jgi:hypothetical protein